MMGDMANPGYLLGIYLHLAHASQQRQRPHVRDRFLILAGSLASFMQLENLANYCRQKVLEHNKHHLVGRWPSMAGALADDDFLCFLRQIQRRFPLEKASEVYKLIDEDPKDIVKVIFDLSLKV